MPHIFISYAKKDTRPLADKLFDMINGMESFSAWMDKSLEAGNFWAQEIQDEIDKADLMIVLLSPDVNRRPTPTQDRSFVLNEIDFAKQESKPIVPIMAQQTRMPVQIAGLEYIDFMRDEKAGMRRLLGRLQKLSLNEPSIASPPASGASPSPKASAHAEAIDKRKPHFTLVVAVVGLFLLAIAAFNFLPPLFNNTIQGTQVADNSSTATNNLSPEPSQSDYDTALERALNFNGSSNDDWTPYLHTFPDGIEMMLVPSGCFIMGSTEEQIQYTTDEFHVTGDRMADEQPAQRYCFNEPFWIDQTEVTQADFARLGGEKSKPNYYIGDNLPVENITWFEARYYCELRGKHLPTEAEWMYAARGIESLIFPWGNEFVIDNVVSNENSGNQTAEVESHPNGVSWVGALDLSGNVWEWTSSLYMNYPYDNSDGRETNTGNTTDVLRVMLGGSWNNVAYNLRSPNRDRYNPSYTGNNVGFRCARSIN
jgi:formylglycine-generating enzyme required for sulfatase activity